MAEIGIDNIVLIVENSVSIVNAVEKIKNADLAKVLVEIYDASEEELVTLASKVGMLDLTDDLAEAKIKSVADSGARLGAMILRIVRLLVKKPV